MSRCCYSRIRRSNNRVIFGVSQGLADHFDLPVVWIRIGWIVLTALTFPVGLIIYIILAFVLKPESAPPPPPQWDEEFYSTDRSYEALGLQRLKGKFEAIEARIQRMENYVTNRSYDWERRLKTGK